MIKKLVTTMMLLKQLKETRDHIKDLKERNKIMEKITQIKGSVEEMKHIINNTKRMLDQKKSEDDVQDGYKAVHENIVAKLKEFSLKITQVSDPKELNNIREKLRKLTDLYKLLKTGTTQNALRSAIMKKMVNVNSSILQGMSIYKLQNE